jgi:hypothetical protein
MKNLHVASSVTLLGFIAWSFICYLMRIYKTIIDEVVQ